MRIQKYAYRRPLAMAIAGAAMLLGAASAHAADGWGGWGTIGSSGTSDYDSRRDAIEQWNGIWGNSSLTQHQNANKDARGAALDQQMFNDGSVRNSTGSLIQAPTGGYAGFK